MKHFKKYFLIATILILESITLVVCEKKTEGSEEYKVAQKVTGVTDQTNYTIRNEIQKEQTDDDLVENSAELNMEAGYKSANSGEPVKCPMYLLYFFSTDNVAFTVSSNEQLDEEDFHIDMSAKGLLNANTILKANTKTKEKMEVMFGEEEIRERFLDNYVYIVDESYKWSYQIFAICSISESRLENINFNNRTEFNNYITTLFLTNDDKYCHLALSAKQTILEDWHIISLYIPSSSSQKNGCIIQATLQSVSSL